ncbi:enolase C-terminal domain-like protein [Pseudogracilibacillus sp. SO30301A]|uniref:enolase C-terminal domain-like protein n=1 Tax=Pseudogracilibacillus sp. SO30301A TaxID=3098291 RepID=UPI003FA7472F
MEAIRETVDPNILIMADANCAYNVPELRRLIKKSELLNVHFFEELLAPEDMEGYTQIRNLSSTI